MRYLKLTTLILLAGSFNFKSTAQSLPLGTPGVEDYYRRSQLLGQLDSSVSFMVRPVMPKSAFGKKDVFYLEDETRYNLLDADHSWGLDSGKFKAMLLPLSIQNQVNTHHPYGWNDGVMIPAKGLQTVLSAGIYAEYGPLTIQFRPEVVLAANTGFDTFDKDHYDVIAARYYDFYNNIDLPARFGNSAYNRAYWGQSSIRLNYKALSFGLSTENLWWGPGMRNSLLMSNTAPGFKHLTLNTRKPISTPIGSFEGQLIAGRLESSGFGVLDPEREYYFNPLYVPKRNDWRYLSGLVVTYQPKWIPGLFLGISRTAQTYSDDLNSFGDYLPFFSRVKRVVGDESLNERDEHSSIFMRWLWPEEHAEIYFEYGHSNSTQDLRGALLEPQQSRAYLFGLRKILPFNKSRDENIMINVEVTQMQETSPEKIKTANSWYLSKSIRHGYTNRGEVLGAGIGPGGNLQSLDVSWFKGLKRIGLQLERYVHNNDFYFYAYEDSVDPRRHWTDLSLAANGEWNYKNFIFNAKLQGIKSLNYQWYLFQGPDDPIWINGRDAFNIQVQAGVTYRF